MIYVFEDVAMLYLTFTVETEYDFVFSENGLVAYKDGKVLAITVCYLV
jgi:hypothetical protein